MININQKQKIYRRLKYLTAQTLFKNALQVGLIYSIALVLQFTADIVFGRLLNPNEYGQIAFIRQTVIFAITFTFLGIDSSLVRIISHTNLSQFKWRVFSRRILTIFIVLSSIITIVIGFIYSLTWEIVLTILLSAFAGSGALVYSALLRSNSNFFKAQLSTQLWKIILGILSLVLLVINKINFNYAIILITLAYVSNFLFSYQLTRDLPEGDVEISLKKVFSEGFLFWVNSGALLLTSVVDQFIIVKLLGFEAFSPYIASWNIIGFFYILVSSSISFVIVPSLINRTKSISSMKRLALILFGLSLIISLILLLTSNTLIKLAYNGKYEASIQLVSVFILIGVTRLIYLLPSTIITALGTTREIGTFSFVGFGGVILNITVAMLLIPNFGLVGAAIGSLSGWLFRITLGIFQIVKIKRRENLVVV